MPRVTLFRAVNADELAQIVSEESFKNLKGNEVKYFAETLEGAQRYAEMALVSYDEYLVVVSTTIEGSLIDPAFRITVDGGIACVVLPTALLHYLTSPESAGIEP